METNLQMILIAMAGFTVLFLGARVFFTRSSPSPAPARRTRPPAARTAPTPFVSLSERAAAEPPVVEEDPLDIEPGDLSLVPMGQELKKLVTSVLVARTAAASPESRIRDRYIQARFPGVMGKSEDFADADAVIKAARIYFEDGNAVRGAELLQFATDMDSSTESLWLGRLQLDFLRRDTDGFALTARRMRLFHPASANWLQISALGYNLGLTPDYFTELGVPASPMPKAGAWPELPDWLQASWDLTPEVVAAELRTRLMAATDPAIAPSRMKQAA